MSYSDFSIIITSLDCNLPQLGIFIDQFKQICIDYHLQVVTIDGSMNIDVPLSMSDSQVASITKRLGIIDRLINTKGSIISELLSQGLDIESRLRQIDPNYKSILNNQSELFKTLSEQYKQHKTF